MHMSLLVLLLFTILKLGHVCLSFQSNHYLTQAHSYDVLKHFQFLTSMIHKMY